MRVCERLCVGYARLFVPAGACALWQIRDVVGNGIHVYMFAHMIVCTSMLLCENIKLHLKYTQLPIF